MSNINNINCINSGLIKNIIYKNGKEVSDDYIRNEPEKAWYTKDGKVLCALEDSSEKARAAYQKYLEDPKAYLSRQE